MGFIWGRVRVGMWVTAMGRVEVVFFLVWGKELELKNEFFF